MSSMTSFRRKNLTEETPFSLPSPVKKRRRRFWILGLIVLVVFWFLPGIVARTPVVQWAIDTAAADLNGRVAVDSVSLGWLSPIRVGGISLNDENQQQVLAVPWAESSRTLAGLLINRSRLGTFRLVEPKLTVALQDGATNVEQVLVEYLKPSDEPVARVDLALEIVDGSITVTDVDRARSWNIEKLKLDLRIPPGAGPLELTVSGAVADPQQAGQFGLSLQMPLDAPSSPDAPQKPLAALASSDAAPDGEGSATPDVALRFHAESLPLALLEPFLARFSPGTRIGGLLTADVDAELGGGDAPQRRVKAKASARDFQLAAAALGHDRIELAQLSLDAEALSRGKELVISPSTIQCDLGQVVLAGSVDLSEKSRQAMPGALAGQTLEIEGSVDLARLAAMLPATLQLRPEMKVTSGHVQMALKSERGEAGMIWQGQLASSELKALDGGREVAWEQPVRIEFAAQETAEGPLAGELRCLSDFLKVHAVGTTRQFTADASFNLDRLAEQLGQFVDLGPLGLNGEGWSHLTWKRSPEGAFEAEVELHVTGLHVALPDRQPWQERELIVFGTASGHTKFGTDTRVEAATLQLAAGAERIEARLLRPVLDVADGGTWPVAVQMHGELAQWPSRLAIVYDLREYPVAGRYELTGQVTASRRTIHAAETVLRVDALDCTLPGVRIVEPQAQLDLTGTWDLDSGGIALTQTTLRTTSLAAATNDLAMTPGDGGALKLSGTLAYQGHLGGVQRWFTDPAARPSWNIDGRLTGTSRFEYSGGKTHGAIEAEVENLQVAGTDSQPFHDPRVTLAGRGSYDSASHAVVLDGLKVSSETVTLDGQGGMNMSGEVAVMQFNGQMQYDMQQLSALLRPYVGSGVELAGRHTSPLSFAGPLDLQHARGSGALAWQQGGVYGFPLGPGELKMNLAGGILAAEPLAIPVSQGRLQFEPKLHLAPGPMALTLEPGPLATRVQITPAMCASGLQYVAPVLAGVTTAQGAFSIELDRCRVPLDNPNDADMAGRLIVHSVEVGPGPLIRELAVLLQREAPARLRRESVVPFRMVAGRVHHEDLELIFPDVTIRTQGSVGIDQTVSLVASLPVPPKWLTNDILRSAFQGQEVRIPVGGTLSAPRLDRVELDKWNRRLLENAAQNVIRDQVEQGLNRLLRPR
ncbi:MAG: hypothetical protein RBS80_03920 [Thermoguttaceae bacterium]|jgi:hypothetical protein|nr:hypothetical protein [Thermoguttaceae bacterium]